VIHSENIQAIGVYWVRNGISRGDEMIKYLGFIAIGVLVLGGVIAAQNSRQPTQNLATEAASLPPAPAAAPDGGAEKRIALVIGNAGYQAGALVTPVNDAGLIAQTLQAAGFDVVGARDLDQDSLRHTFRDFVEKATNSGPDTVAFVYVSGYGLQLEGENYFVPVDAKIARDSDIPSEALRISDYSRPLAALKLKASIIVLDAARANSFAQGGTTPLAGGLALVDPDPGVLIAFNAAPGTVAPEGQGPYGPYAQALAEMLREGGLPLPGVFERARLRVNELTAGAEVPWDASKLGASVVLFERTADAPPPAVSVEEAAAIRARPIRKLAPPDAYALALERDTLEGYNEFLVAYPADPMALRVRAIVAARREAITWRRSRVIDTAPAYWSYLRRYPEGPHVGDAHRRLAFLSFAYEPPPRFAVVDYDVPPPPPDEIVYIRRPVLVFSDPIFGFAPPPPAPIFFLAPPPPEFVVLAPPPIAVGLFVLPVPIYRPVPVWVRPPAFVVPPPANNVIFNNVHNTVVINNVTNTVTVTNQAGRTTTLPPPAPPPGAPAGTHASFGPSLPPAVAQKAALQSQNPPVGAGAAPTAAPTKPLPGMQSHPLPAPATPATPANPTAPSAAVTPATPSPTSPPGGAKPATPPPPAGASKPAPAAKLTAPPANAKPVTTAPSAPSGALAPPPKPATPPPAKVVTPTAPPPPPKPATRQVVTPTAPPPPPKPAAPPPARVVTPAAPPPPAPPPQRPPAPAAAAKAAPCPPGKTAAIVNGHPTCR
jgi:uncharacterized caspase-like protein